MSSGTVAINGHVRRKIFVFQGQPSVSLNGEICKLYDYNLDASTFKVAKRGDEFVTVVSKESVEQVNGDSVSDLTAHLAEQTILNSERAQESLTQLAAKYNMSEEDLASQRASIQALLEESLAGLHAVAQSNRTALETAIVASNGAKETADALKSKVRAVDDVMEGMTSDLSAMQKRAEVHEGMLGRWLALGYLTACKEMPLLHSACEYGDLNFVKQLVYSGMWNVADGAFMKYDLSPFGNEKTFSPLHVALRFGQIEVARFLVTHCKPLLKLATPARGITPMLCAAAGSAEAVRWTFNIGASIRGTSPNGLTVAHVAAMAGKKDVLTLLETYASDLLSKTNNAGVNPVHCAALKGRLDVLKWYVPVKSVLLVMPDSAGLGIHHYAAANNHTHILDYLYESNYDLAERDKRGLRIAHHAALKGAVHSLRWIRDHNYNPNPLDNQGRTAHQLAIENNVLASIQFYDELQHPASQGGYYTTISRK